MSYDRFIRAVVAGVWCIERERGEQMLAAFQMRMENGRRVAPYLVADELKANQMRASVQTLQLPSSDGAKIGILPMVGAIMPRGGDMEDMSGGGGCPLSRFNTRLKTMRNDASYRQIIIDCDSPGGNVSGVAETCALVKEVAAEKPVIAVANGMMCSAAYWALCHATEIVASPSALVGSIGVIGTQIDESVATEAAGIKVNYRFAGPRKIDGNPYEPLSDIASKRMQERTDEFYGMFVSDVSKGRGASPAVVRADPETANRHFGGGDALSAKQAVALGMADRVGTLQSVVDAGVKNGGKYKPKKRSAATARANLAFW